MGFSLGALQLTTMASASQTTIYRLIFVVSAVFVAHFQCHGFQIRNGSSIRSSWKASNCKDDTCSGESTTVKEGSHHRREVLRSILASSASLLVFGHPRKAFSSGADTVAESLDVQDFLRRGVAVNPMGVSGQAGKSRPVTGVILRDGSIPSRDETSGAVLAEILIGNREQPVPVLASFISPWPLATGSVFDVECRNPKTGDGVFLAITESTNGKSNVKDLPDSFFLDDLFQPYGRFSFYGTPTDIKVRKSYIEDETNKRTIEVSFSSLSQSTQSEIPRIAIISATIPKGTENAVMLVASASASRWKKGAEAPIRSTIDSFRVTLAPKSSLKMRPRDRSNSNAVVSM